MSAAAPVLALRGITAGYGRTTVLRDVDLDVSPGKIDALIGPNGAGKTTLLRVAAGLLKPNAGTVTHEGVDITRQSPAKRARGGVCLVPEGRSIFPNLTVRENLRLQTPPQSTTEVGLDVALDAFPILRDRLGQTAGRLSGGQQQMLALARCYLAAPSVVLLDEVSMGLAPRIIDQIFESLLKLAASGVSLLLVEQYVNRALEMADTVHMLTRGAIVYAGTPDKLDEAAVMRGYLGADLQADAEGGAPDGSATGDAPPPL